MSIYSKESWSLEVQLAWNLFVEFLCPFPLSLKLKLYMLCQSKPVAPLKSKILLSDC